MSKNLKLLPDDPPLSSRNLLEVVTGSSTQLSAAQKSFKQLLTSVENAEALLQQLLDLVGIYRSKFSQTLSPLERERDVLNYELVVLLDGQMLVKGRTKGQRNTIITLIEYLADNLMQSEFADEVDAILDKHQPAAERADEKMMEAQFEATLEELFGVNLGDDLDKSTDENAKRTPQELWEETLRQMGEEAEQNQRKAEAHANKKRGGKKSAKDKKAEQENIDASKLLKDIYRKLTSALHPDREPDEAERARKTALMVEVNKAYAANNLLQLMRLQFQTIKVDAGAAATMADQKLLLINRSLKQQFTDLQQERFTLESMVRQEFHLPYTRTVTAKSLDKELASIKASLSDQNSFMRTDMKRLSRSEADFKIWLKQQKQLIEEDEDFEIDETLNDLFMEALLTPKKRR